jgi:CHASE3 domain sensor protein
VRNHIFTAELAGGLAATIIFLLVARVTVRSVAETSDAETRTFAVKARLDRLFLAIAEAELEQESMPSREQGYSAPDDRATGAILSEIGQIRKLTLDNPAHQADLDRLQTLVDIEKREGTTQEFGLGIDPEATSTRMPPMDDMRTVVTGMAAREDRLLAIQMEQAGRSYREAFLVGLLGTGLTAIAAIACFFELGWSELEPGCKPAPRPERERPAQLDKNDDPTSKHRTDEVTRLGRLI